MKTILPEVKKVFFVGIGGSGISAIARLFLQEGKTVSGSDTSWNETIRTLQDVGATITLGQAYDLIPTDTDLIIYTVAIKHHDPVLYKKITGGEIPARSYPEMLRIVSEGKYTIAISGTHGKTTTTAMIARTLKETGNDPTVIVGSVLKDYGSNLVVGGSPYFVVEACEYERSFLNIYPEILVITNIEADHLDYYKDLTDIENAFSALVAQTKTAIVCDPSSPSVKRVIAQTDLPVIDYTNFLKDVPELSVPGEYNRKNAAVALAVCDFLSIEKSKEPLRTFSGTARRMEYKGITADGAPVYDDYAHHPTEVEVTLTGVRESFPGKRIVVVFQPHLPSRTKAFFSEFVQALGLADELYVLPVFLAREKPDPTVSAEKLAEYAGGTACASIEDAVFYCKEASYGDDTIIITMGAGEAYKVGEQLVV